MSADLPTLLREALPLLGVRNFVLGIHEPSLPCRPEEDLGRGALASRGTEELLERISQLGMNGLQLGPMGLTNRGNPSPYDSTLFSRNPLSLATGPLVEAGLLSEKAVQALLQKRPPGFEERVPYDFLHDAVEQLLGQLAGAVENDPATRAQVDAYRQRNASWLLPDALWEPLVAQYGSHLPREWQGTEGALDAELWSPHPVFAETAAKRRSALEQQHAEEIHRYALAQWLVEEQHALTRQRCAARGIKLYGDLQIGVSTRDEWTYARLFLRTYRMGAPPSRTNPEGQPWNYPVLDPDQVGTLDSPGAALRLVAARMNRMLRDFDSVRIDHPHGWVCPWVYRADVEDALRAVQGGARLFESPDLEDHPELARYARVRPEQLNHTLPRHADHRVRSLTPEQVDGYAVLIDTIVAAARAQGREVADLICEVLSTLPAPLEAVMRRHGLGRFRVLQKAALQDPTDVYRSENARREDWVMIGNHDTPSIWELIPRWGREGKLVDRAHYLAWRLVPERERAAFARTLLESPGRIAHAMLADALASPAENTMLFFTDLFGIEAPYNVPGTQDPGNWTLRLTRERLTSLAQRAGEDRALDVPRAVAWALRARGTGEAIAQALLATP